MVPMRDHQIVATLHEPPLPIPLLRSERRRGCPEGGRGGSIGSWSQLTSKFFEVFALHEPTPWERRHPAGRFHRLATVRRQDAGAPSGSSWCPHSIIKSWRLSMQ